VRTRRELLKDGAGVAAAAALGGLWADAAAAAPPSSGAWEAGPVQHLLPTVTHDRVRLKASFAGALREAPRLRIGATTVDGERSDSAGRFWSWDLAGLVPDRHHRMQLLDARGRHVAEPWSLRTFPAPNARPKRLRLLIFTCAGGNDVVRDAGIDLFQSARVRNRLLRRGLAFDPDAIIANGDHMYWDLEAGISAQFMGASQFGREKIGVFHRAAPTLGGHNEAVLLRAAGPQIVDVYGTDCRSVPMFFLTDDHDYFENDVADDTIVTFPPPWWKLQLARATQRLYYPELLPVPGQPEGLAWRRRRGPRHGLSECFGALRYGRLLEFLMYDIRRTVTLAGPSAVFFDAVAERWVRDRIGSTETTHVVNMPSNPPGWSAGKWGEWYPDVAYNGRLTTAQHKPFWQSGWLAQHDRLLSAISARRRGVPLVIGGDLHVTAAGTASRTGHLDLSQNPVQIALSGTLGTDRLGFPSTARGISAQPPSHLDLQEQIAPLEENGFLLAELTVEGIVLKFFRWNSTTQSEDEIDRLRPFHVLELGSS
jgi:hypothetical protein